MSFTERTVTRDPDYMAYRNKLINNEAFAIEINSRYQKSIPINKLLLKYYLCNILSTKLFK